MQQNHWEHLHLKSFSFNATSKLEPVKLLLTLLSYGELVQNVMFGQKNSFSNVSEQLYCISPYKLVTYLETYTLSHIQWINFILCPFYTVSITLSLSENYWRAYNLRSFAFSDSKTAIAIRVLNMKVFQSFSDCTTLR